MKKKKLLALIMAIIIFILPITGCTRTEITDILGKKVTPLLYKISDEDSVIWVFGSIHVGREEFYPLPDYVMEAFEASDALAVEFDIVAFEKDLKAQTAAMTQLVYTDGTGISDHIPAELYNSAVEIFEENNIYGSYLDFYVPSLWASLIDNLAIEEHDSDSKYGVDMHLLNLAKENEKEIIDIESAQEQYMMLKNYSPELQEFLLAQSVKSYGESSLALAELDYLLDLWMSGNEKNLSIALSSPAEYETEEEERLYKEYDYAMIESRNLKMTDFAQEALEDSREVFICVGAAHVVGEGGIAKELEKRGYKVEIVR